ncbi:hypothetical protein HPB52_005113 [Rhipicephalus sanguineus]|uniref:Uncharacterized protein n=2 Tax=Rhipicephalus sanguineus TaxID=34632 RepID=A0A9D4PC27_RHISA|nr:hypothetical protein HPB52_024514 [Rhipicephalus sanguineus]KAH7967997.1 hypothetical protein HPB52_005113 [Rhipicephalus sanguineus]
MDSTSTSPPDSGGRDDGREEARHSGVTQTSAGNVATSTTQNATTMEQSASRAEAPAAPVDDGGADRSAKKDLDYARSFSKAPATCQSMPRSDDARPEARTITAGERYLYALNLHKNCPILMPLKIIVKHLEDLEDEFEKAHLDFQMPCTMTDAERCWLSDNVRTFNQILVRAKIETVEIEPGRLFIRTFHLGALLVQHQAPRSTYALLRACILLDLLLKGQRCIHELCLDPDYCGHVVREDAQRLGFI